MMEAKMMMMILNMTMSNLKIKMILKTFKIVKNLKLKNKLLIKVIMSQRAKNKTILNPNNQQRVKRQLKMSFD